jgi:hypothetical protein
MVESGVGGPRRVGGSEAFDRFDEERWREAIVMFGPGRAALGGAPHSRLRATGASRHDAQVVSGDGQR